MNYVYIKGQILKIFFVNSSDGLQSNSQITGMRENFKVEIWIYGPIN